MAVVWRKKSGADTYEVRSAGNTRRLYTNGVLHSHYNPTHQLTSSIWDLILLPALFLPSNSVRRVLLLGVGGGTLIKLLQSCIHPEEIIGVEINPIHIAVAKKYFKVNNNEAELICSDASEWLKHYRGPAFDMIIDDVFGHVHGHIQRPIDLNVGWFTLLNRNLSKTGVLVINTVDFNTLKHSAYFSNKKINGYFRVVYGLEHPGCDNHIGAFFKTLLLKKDLLHNIKNLRDSKLKKALLALDYKLEKIS